MNSTIARGAARRLAPAQTAHPVHGLVAIANGPDYCLCGNVWPCRPIENTPPAVR